MRASSRRIAWPLLAVLALGCTGADDGAEEADEAAGAATASEAEPPETVSEERLSDWNVSLDQDDQDPSGFAMEVTGEGFSVQTGPAGVAWRSVDLVESGDYAASATFTERGGAAGHREAYGILVGGKHLESPDQQYTYFLVRGDGSYLVKRRDGEATSTLVDWTSSDAVRAIETEGEENPNTLTVTVRGDQVEFAVNGSVVETLPADEVEPWGFAGVRVNHGLDVSVADWSLEGGMRQDAGSADAAPAGETDAQAADTAAQGG